MTKLNTSLSESERTLPFWTGIVSVLFITFGLIFALYNSLNLVQFPIVLGNVIVDQQKLAIFYAFFGIILLILNYQTRTIPAIEQEEASLETIVRHERLQLLYANMLFLFLLILSAIMFIFFNPNLFISFETFKTMTFLQRILFTIWFALLGSATISFKGLAEYAVQDSKRQFNKWYVWYLERPCNGFIIGVMTYFLLQILNTDTQPSIPSLAAAAFILSLREYKFYDILQKVSDLVLSTRDDKEER